MEQRSCGEYESVGLLRSQRTRIVNRIGDWDQRSITESVSGIDLNRRNQKWRTDLLDGIRNVEPNISMGIVNGERKS